MTPRYESTVDPSSFEAYMAAVLASSPPAETDDTLDIPIGARS